MVSKKNESHQRHRRCLTLGDEQGPSKGNQQQPSKGGRQGHATGKDHPKATGKDHPKTAGKDHPKATGKDHQAKGAHALRHDCTMSPQTRGSRFALLCRPQSDRCLSTVPTHPGCCYASPNQDMLPSTLHLCTFDLDSIICDP
jgi:hypothetical protein